MHNFSFLFGVVKNKAQVMRHASGVGRASAVVSFSAE
jgi:hypothetical protein